MTKYIILIEKLDVALGPFDGIHRAWQFLFKYLAKQEDKVDVEDYKSHRNNDNRKFHLKGHGEVRFVELKSELQ